MVARSALFMWTWQPWVGLLLRWTRAGSHHSLKRAGSLNWLVCHRHITSALVNQFTHSKRYILCAVLYRTFNNLRSLGTMLNKCVEKTAFNASILTNDGLYFVNIATHLTMIAVLLNFKSSLSSRGIKG